MSRERGREEGTKGGESEEHKIFFMVLFPRETDGRTDICSLFITRRPFGSFFFSADGGNGGEGMGEMGARDEGDRGIAALRHFPPPLPRPIIETTFEA